MPFSILVQAAQQGILPKNIITKDYPKCPSCLYGKSTRHAWRTKTPHRMIAPLVTKPGNVISVDQTESSTPGFLGQNTGRLTQKCYKIATIFVDQASKLGYVYVQQSTNAASTIQAKKVFEAYARALDIEIKHYHADNGVFNSQEFLANVKQSQQTISFCGVGAHHQSGVADHRVRELTEMACTQLLHAMHNNPKAVNVHLWPYALCHASYLFNYFPRHGKTKSPLKIFSSSCVHPNLQHLHPFGCPVYVLASQLQNHQKLPRWNSRTRVRVYLGHSPYHATSMGLILSLDTGLISPQFHCTYNDLFHTPKLDNHATSKWQELVGFDPDNPEAFEDPTDTYSPDEKFFGDFAPPEPDEQTPEGVSGSEGEHVSFLPSQELVPPMAPPLIDKLPTPEEATALLPDPDPDPPNFKLQQSEDQQDFIQPPQPPLAPDPPNPEGLRQSRQIRTAPKEYIPQFGGKAYKTTSFLSKIIDTAYAFMVEVTHAYAYAATQADPDTMTLKQAMQEPDADKFLEAMIKEIDDHVQYKHWHLVTDEQMQASGHTGKPIMGVWSMKHKRNPVREIVKYKAHFCTHGGQTKEGVHYTNTFAPVITWTTIHFLLILSLVHNWHTRQINFVLAYPQAKVSHDLYMLVPDKFKVQNGKLQMDLAAPPPWQQKYKMKLLQNLYGLKDAGATWFNHLKKGLLDRGFMQSQVNPCLSTKRT